MKKITAILLLAAICLSGATLSSCRDTDNTDSVRPAKSESRKVGDTSADEFSTVGRIDPSSSADGKTDIPSSTTKGSVDILPPSSHEAPPPNDTDVLILAGSGISLYYRSVETVGGALNFTFFMQNNSDLSFDVKLEIQALNRFMFGNAASVELLPGCSAVIQPLVYDYLEKAPGVTSPSDIKEVSIKVSFRDDSYKKVFEDCMFTFTINGGAS